MSRWPACLRICKVAKKYTKDYRVTDTLNEQGRRERRVDYIGKTYVWYEGDAARKALRCANGICAIGWAAWLLPLLPRSEATQTWYVLPFFLFIALPLGLLSGALLQLRRSGEVLTHREADQASNRIPGCGLFMTLLPLLSLAGETILFIRQRKLPGRADVLFALGALLLLACGLLLRRMAPHFRTEIRE